MPKFLQVNLNGNWAAEQLLAQTAVDSEADVLIISEPATHYGDPNQWAFSSDRKAAVGTAHHSDLAHDGCGSGDGFAWLSFRELTVFSCYARPGLTVQDFALYLGNLEDAVRARGNSQIVLAGDFNAWNVEWGSRVSNPRGHLLSDLAVSLGLILANEGVTPTFVRGAATSIIDVTFYRGIDCAGWRVLEDDSLSDHQYVVFTTSALGQAHAPAGPPADALLGWSVRKLDAGNLSRFFASTQLPSADGDDGAARALKSAEILDAYLTAACEASMPRKRPGPTGKPPVYWWSEEIAVLRRSCLALRRRYQRHLRRANLPGLTEARIAFALARRNLRVAIRNAKQKCWADLCAQVDTDPWADHTSWS